MMQREKPKVQNEKRSERKMMKRIESENIQHPPASAEQILVQVVTIESNDCFTFPGSKVKPFAASKVKPLGCTDRKQHGSNSRSNSARPRGTGAFDKDRHQHRARSTTSSTHLVLSFEYLGFRVWGLGTRV